MRGKLLVALLVPLTLGGCGVIGLTAATPSSTAGATPAAGAGGSWIVVATGSATPTPGVTYPSRATSLPPPSFPATSGSACPPAPNGEVVIPVTVTPGIRSLTMTWPRRQASGYRVTAVPQTLVTGAQPGYTWINVPATGAGCAVSYTITGLKTGVPYVVWLDAQNTGGLTDGTRNPYSGASGVVYPK
ncbi:fibronectin type III domain-containing protein [Krasilnikovia sp. MM14-A1259]|uniref:fibronectin type III domain-containing protein n=1 Tax=Krasilnikovia sp. MM14-A1259 TaxID=3373539 RepID=UPI00382A8006